MVQASVQHMAMGHTATACYHFARRISQTQIQFFFATHIRCVVRRRSSRGDIWRWRICAATTMQDESGFVSLGGLAVRARRARSALLTVWRIFFRNETRKII